jgi:hypothetical protein
MYSFLFISAFSIYIPLVSGIYAFKQLERPFFRVFFFYVAVIAVAETVAVLLSRQNISNLFVYNLVNMVMFAFLVYLAYWYGIIIIDLLRNERPHSVSYFFLFSAMILYCFPSLSFYLLFDYVQNKGIVFKYYSVFHSLLNIASNSLFAFSLLCQKKNMISL